LRFEYKYGLFFPEAS